MRRVEHKAAELEVQVWVTSVNSNAKAEASFACGAAGGFGRKQMTGMIRMP